MIVYLARDIPAFVMYWVYGASGSSLLIESTDSMIYNTEENKKIGTYRKNNKGIIFKTRKAGSHRVYST